MQFSCTCTLFTCTSSFDVFFYIQNRNANTRQLFINQFISSRSIDLLKNRAHPYIVPSCLDINRNVYLRKFSLHSYKKCVLTKPLLLFFFLNFDKNIIIGFLLMKMHSLIFIFFLAFTLFLFSVFSFWFCFFTTIQIYLLIKYITALNVHVYKLIKQ